MKIDFGEFMRALGEIVRIRRTTLSAEEKATALAREDKSQALKAQRASERIRYGHSLEELSKKAAR